MDPATLNKQAIACAKHYMGKTAWPTIALTLAVVVAFVATLLLFANGSLPALPAFLLVAALTYMSYTPLHEAAHVFMARTIAASGSTTCAVIWWRRSLRFLMPRTASSTSRTTAIPTSRTRTRILWSAGCRKVRWR